VQTQPGSTDPNPAEVDQARRSAYEQQFDSRQIPSPERQRFYRGLSRFFRGQSGLMPEESLSPVSRLAELDELPEPDNQAQLLSDLVVIKLNGGLGTTMGLSSAKGILEVKPGLSYLDIASRQILAMRKKFGTQLPLVLMNSFYTSEVTLEALSPYRDLAVEGLSLELLQSQIPKVDAESLLPARWPADPNLEWCPPGHGEIYFRLQESGMLSQLRQRGFRWAFVSNIDNLGAQVDPRILAWCKRKQLDFLMEATPRTAADRKGGHLAVRQNDERLILRERAQCPPGELKAFEDIEKHRYFNTNNLWINLERLEDALPTLELPVIVNRKTVDPTDAGSPKVVQLESAMGAAIECFPDARALCVPRYRFVPTKNLEDLLLLRSDLFELSPDYEVIFAGKLPPSVTLDPSFYGNIKAFEHHFTSVPSLIECESLKVTGEVFWQGQPARAIGHVDIQNHSSEPLVLDSPGALTGTTRVEAAVEDKR
jgi:UTP--glucose-1-phosphate uridylyltransferase